MIYYRRYIGSYQKRTTRLSMRDHGAYALMLDFYYAEEEPLPLEMEDIYDICKARTPDDRKSVQKVLRLHFDQRADGYHNARADAEIAASKQARTNGKKGGRPPSDQTGNETGNETESLTGDETERVTGTGTGAGGGTVHPTTYNHSAFQPSASKPSADTLQPSENSSAARSKRSPKTPLPDSFGLSPRVTTWAQGKQFDRLDEHLEAFVSVVKQHDYRYVDWDEALMTAIRKDWAGLRKGTRPGNQTAAIDEAARRIFSSGPERDVTG